MPIPYELFSEAMVRMIITDLEMEMNTPYWRNFVKIEGQSNEPLNNEQTQPDAQPAEGETATD